MRIAVALALALSVGACASVRDSRLNPLNLFGPGRQATAPIASGPGVDGRPLVARVTRLDVTPNAGGVVIEARGLPASQGFHDAALVPLADGEPVGGVLTYQFRVQPPEVAARQGPPASREVVVGAAVSSLALAGVETIRVEGAVNALEARR